MTEAEEPPTDPSDVYEVWIFQDLRESLLIGLVGYPQSEYAAHPARYWVLDPQASEVELLGEHLSRIGYGTRTASDMEWLFGCLEHNPLAHPEELVIVGKDLPDLGQEFITLAREEVALPVTSGPFGLPSALLLRMTGPYVMQHQEMPRFAQIVEQQHDAQFTALPAPTQCRSVRHRRRYLRARHAS